VYNTERLVRALSVVHVAPSLQFLLDVRMRSERMPLQHLRLQRVMKPFVLAIIVAVGPARHTLCQTVLLEQSPVSRHLVLPALIRT
jgi:hypothetical protein